ncbi:ATP-binding cassette domain-containing protein [Nocardioides yefusunii]|uniref:ATP-binding cassette domain-containing protein n=1 Tax=Nocardioides yefusunii TaxID=2500546 RepID=A0ABW1QUA4_9ACTN|nr:ATP-binding cassette domain-containing protein [Nocardioides yefusunii]
MTKTYEHRRILDRVSTSARDGAVTGIVGPLGAGASTLLRIVAGVVRPDEGAVTFDGTTLPDAADPPRTVGSFLGSEQIPDRLTPRSFLKYVRALAGAPRSRVGELLDLADLTHVPDQLVKDLSTSQRQRLGIAAATVGHPHHLVLDEPLAGLQPGDVGWVQGLLREHADRGGAVLLSSSHLDAVAPLVDQVVEMDRGRVVREGAIATFLAPGTPRTYVETDDLETARTLLVAQSWLVERHGDGLVVDGATPEQVGAVLFADGPGATQVRALGRAGDGGRLHPADAVRAVRAAARRQ